MKKKTAQRIAVNERRAYFECHCGQLHVRTAFPSTGGFDERRSLLCLHDVATTSASFAGLVSALGTDRSIYAIDLPGHGESDPLPGSVDVAAYAKAVADLIDGLRLREVDVLGQGLGAAVAAELALLKPSVVHSVVLVDGPTAPLGPLPVWAPNAKGDGLAEAFRAGMSRFGRQTSLTAGVSQFAQALVNGHRINDAAAALSAWLTQDRWKQLRHRSIALDCGERRAAVADLIPAGRSMDGESTSADALWAQSADLATALRAFLDAVG